MREDYPNITAPVFNIQTYSIHAGPGIRVTVFVKGCPLRCKALTAEYEHYFALCRPLMRVFTMRDGDAAQKAADSLVEADGNAFLCSAMPPFLHCPRKPAGNCRSDKEDTGVILAKSSVPQATFIISE